MMSSIPGAAACAAAASMGSRGPDPAKLQQQLLAKIDSNGDQAIDKAELTSFTDYVGSKTSSETTDADALFSALDTDSDGSITPTELADNGKALFDQLRDQLMSSKLSNNAPPPPPSDDPSEMFAKIDANSDGNIDKTELTAFFAERGDAADSNAPSVDDIFARDDSDSDGSISTAEFESAMSRRADGPPPGDDSQRGMQINKLIASLLEQYAASSSTATSSTTAFAAVA